jgi:putative endonuclease
MCYVYVVFSVALNKYYVGVSDNVSRRLNEHNSGKGKFTSAGTPWILIKEFLCRDRKEALSLENKIKKRGIERYLKDQGFNFSGRSAAR